MVPRAASSCGVHDGANRGVMQGTNLGFGGKRPKMGRGRRGPPGGGGDYLVGNFLSWKQMTLYST